MSSASCSARIARREIALDKNWYDLKLLTTEKYFALAASRTTATQSHSPQPNHCSSSYIYKIHLYNVRRIVTCCRKRSTQRPWTLASTLSLQIHILLVRRDVKRQCQVIPLRSFLSVMALIYSYYPGPWNISVTCLTTNRNMNIRLKVLETTISHW